MIASDVMVSNVITVTPDATVTEVAELLLKNRISGLPVVDDKGEMVGIVSEGDLLHRAEAGTERRRSWWLELFSSKQTLATEFVKSHATRVADIMSREVVTAAPDTPLAEIAEMLEKRRIKRVPIVKGRRLVGIVSRSNLLQALATKRGAIAVNPQSDSELRDAIMVRLQHEAWAAPNLLNPIVHDGAVEIWGLVESDTERQAVRVAVETTPGVASVTDHLVVQRLVGGS